MTIDALRIRIAAAQIREAPESDSSYYWLQRFFYPVIGS